MKTTSLHCYDCPKGLHVVVFLVAMLSISSHSADAMTADLVPQDFRVSVAADNVKNAWRYAVAYQLRPPRRLRARHLELAIGAIATTSQTHAFVSFGPVWQLPLARGNDRWHVQLGVMRIRRRDGFRERADGGPAFPTEDVHLVIRRWFISRRSGCSCIVERATRFGVSHAGKLQHARTSVTRGQVGESRMRSGVRSVVHS